MFASFIPDSPPKSSVSTCAEPPDAALVAEIEHAIDRHPVLVLRNQDLTDDQHIAFTRPFGDLQQSTEYLTETGEFRLPALMTDASNLGKDNKTFGPGDARRMANLGSRRWHTDGSFKMRPVKYSLLAARTVTRQGGETQFADMRGAYDALPDDLKERIDGLIVEHNLLHSRRMVGLRRSQRARESPPGLGAPAAGAPAPADRAQVALPVVARVAHRGLAAAGGPRPPV